MRTVPAIPGIENTLLESQHLRHLLSITVEAIPNSLPVSFVGDVHPELSSAFVSAGCNQHCLFPMHEEC